ncbi:MAG: hypothetical protein HY392_05190 [Candidatus Diapherotrites archaeon]|nr:hypothetical protein [Candidatus Diapherotrites archaeon]
MEEEQQLNGLMASFVALRLKPEKNINISGIELQFLEKINASEKLISVEELAKFEKVPNESAVFIVDSLYKKKLIDHGSGWQTTELGKEIVKEALKIYNESKPIIETDRTFSLMLEATGKKLEP